ncbi:MAG: ABC transporter permease [Deltaproteobacteria bacterium]|nr:ABC transporter permease [Deltaproteobacteria bacterium]
MTIWRLIARGLRHHAAAHLAVGAGVALAAAILVGSLAVGDSVEQSLVALERARLGTAEAALETRGRWVRSELAPAVARQIARPVAPVLALDAVAATPQGDRRLPGVRLYGVDSRFFALFGEDGVPAPGTVHLSAPLASRLGVQAGDTLVFRVAKPDPLPGSAPMARDEAPTLGLSVEVAAGDARPADRFALRPEPQDPPNAFVDLAWLQEAAGLEGKASLLLVGGPGRPGSDAAQEANRALAEAVQLEDLGLEMATVLPAGGDPLTELRSKRVLLEPPVVEAALAAVPDATQVAAWFVNRIAVGERAAPYSFVAAIDPAPGGLAPGPGGIALGQWLADDLKASPGDEVTLSAYVFDGGRSLREETHTFQVSAVLPMEGAAVDRTLMPTFPGFEDAPRCRDWDPGVPIDTSAIRDADEAFWKRWGGAPKAFVSMADARHIWQGPFGLLTALRVPPAQARRLAAGVREGVDPARVGLAFRGLGGVAGAGAEAVAVAGPGAGAETETETETETGAETETETETGTETGAETGTETGAATETETETATASATDFGGLFLGFSFLLLVSALLLTALVFALALLLRASELRTLSALGFSRGRVRAVVLGEGVAVAVPSALLGAGLGLLFAESVLSALASGWSDVTTGLPLRFAVSGGSLAIGASSAVIASLVAMVLTLRGVLRARSEAERLRRPTGLVVGLLAVTGAVALTLGAPPGRSPAAAGAFFGAGALALIAAAGLTHELLRRLGRPGHRPARSLGGLSLRNLARHPQRSLAVVSLLGAGTFLVVGVGTNRHDPRAGAEQRGSGTGGFALAADASLPVRADLDTRRGLESVALSREELDGARVVSLRVRDGDDASCRSPAQARVPRLLGVDPLALASRGAFHFTSHAELPESKSPWTLLSELPAAVPGAEAVEVPVIGDEGTVVWGLHLGLGDALETQDELGRTLRLRVVGITETSILQGALVMGDSAFRQAFPSESGFRSFLIDAPPERAAAVAARLEDALLDQGFRVQPAWKRLLRFQEVENTYLAIFLALGALGLVLGALGTGALVVRNVVERRTELALLEAIGFSRRRLSRLVLAEHASLLAAGVLTGGASALLAVLPALRGDAPFPWAAVALTVAAAFVAGLLATAIATRLSLRRPLARSLADD